MNWRAGYLFIRADLDWRKVMRKLMFFTVLLGFSCLPLAAQDYPKAELFGGYQFTHLEPSLNANGWNASLTGNLNSWFGGNVDFSGAYKSGVKFHTFMFGPVVSLRKSELVTPFAHVLVGAARLSDGGSTTGFSMAVGGGLDVKVNSHFAVRLVQADWLPYRVAQFWVKKNTRVSAGIVIRF
jgi:opacity protein-like surface antigen